MITGIGIDLVDIDRIERMYRRFGDRFLQRILSPGERAARPKAVPPWLASRFAVKEAAVKALGTGFANGITPCQIETGHEAGGRPCLRLYGAALQRAHAMGVAECHVSLSHERHLAIAVVILES